MIEDVAKKSGKVIDLTSVTTLLPAADPFVSFSQKKESIKLEAPELRKRAKEYVILEQCFSNCCIIFLLVDMLLVNWTNNALTFSRGLLWLTGTNPILP